MLLPLDISSDSTTPVRAPFYSLSTIPSQSTFILSTMRITVRLLAGLFQCTAGSAFAPLLNPPWSRKLFVAVWICPVLIESVIPMIILVNTKPVLGFLLGSAYLTKICIFTSSLLRHDPTGKISDGPLLLSADVVRIYRDNSFWTVLPFFESEDVGKPFARAAEVSADPLTNWLNTQLTVFFRIIVLFHVG